MAGNRPKGRRARTTGHRRTPTIQRFTRLADQYAAAGVAAPAVGAPPPNTDRRLSPAITRN